MSLPGMSVTRHAMLPTGSMADSSRCTASASLGAPGRCIPWGELVVCVDGEITLYQEIDGDVRTTTISKGEAVINPAGVWHTADVEGTASALFVTAGMGTENRAR